MRTKSHFLITSDLYLFLCHLSPFISVHAHNFYGYKALFKMHIHFFITLSVFVFFLQHVCHNSLHFYNLNNVRGPDHY